MHSELIERKTGQVTNLFGGGSPAQTPGARQSNRGYHLKPSGEHYCRGKTAGPPARADMAECLDSSHRDVRSKEKRAFTKRTGGVGKREGRESVMHSPSIQRAAWRTKIRHPGPGCRGCWSKASPPTRAMTARLWPAAPARSIYSPVMPLLQWLPHSYVGPRQQSAQNIIRGTREVPWTLAIDLTDSPISPPGK